MPTIEKSKIQRSDFELLMEYDTKTKSNKPGVLITLEKYKGISVIYSNININEKEELEFSYKIVDAPLEKTKDLDKINKDMDFQNTLAEILCCIIEDALTKVKAEDLINN